MNYQQHFTQRISGYLEQLRQELDEDIPRLRELVPDVTLGQADTYVEQVSGLVATYDSLFRREAKRSQSSSSGMSYYQRRKVLLAYDEKIEAAFPSVIEKEGYVTGALVQQHVGIEENEAEKRLKSLAKKHNWRTKQDPLAPETVRYLPARSRRQQNGPGETSEHAEE